MSAQNELDKSDRLALEFDNHVSKLKDFEKKLDRVLFLLDDDAKTGSLGVVRQTHKNTVEIENIKSDIKSKRAEDKGKKSVYIFIGGIITFIAANIDDIYDGIKHFFEK